MIRRLKQAIGDAKTLPAAGGSAMLLPDPVELPVLCFRVGLDDVIDSLQRHGKKRAPA